MECIFYFEGTSLITQYIVVVLKTINNQLHYTIFLFKRLQTHMQTSDTHCNFIYLQCNVHLFRVVKE